MWLSLPSPLRSHRQDRTNPWTRGWYSNSTILCQIDDRWRGPFRVLLFWCPSHVPATHLFKRYLQLPICLRIRFSLLPFLWLALFNKLAESMSMSLTGRSDLDIPISLWCPLGFRNKLWVLLVWWVANHFGLIRDLSAPLRFYLRVFSLNAAVCGVWCLYYGGRRQDLFIQSFIQKSFYWLHSMSETEGKKLSETWFSPLRSTWPHKEIDTKMWLWCSDMPYRNYIVEEKQQFLRS